MKVYRYKLYTNAKRGELKELIYRFGIVRNYAVKMFHGYYKLTGKSLSAYQLSNHIAKAKKNQNRRTAKMVVGAHHDRDVNAAKNILLVGTSTNWRGSVRPRSERSVA